MVISVRVAKTKALISFAVTAKLICAFVFAYANCWFSDSVWYLFQAYVGAVPVVTPTGDGLKRNFAAPLQESRFV